MLLIFSDKPHHTTKKRFADLSKTIPPPQRNLVRYLTRCKNRLCQHWQTLCTPQRNLWRYLQRCKNRVWRYLQTLCTPQKTALSDIRRTDAHHKKNDFGDIYKVKHHRHHTKKPQTELKPFAVKCTKIGTLLGTKNEACAPITTEQQPQSKKKVQFIKLAIFADSVQLQIFLHLCTKIAPLCT